MHLDYLPDNYSDEAHLVEHWHQHYLMLSSDTNKMQHSSHFQLATEHLYDILQNILLYSLQIAMPQTKCDAAFSVSNGVGLW